LKKGLLQAVDGEAEVEVEGVEVVVVEVLELLELLQVLQLALVQPFSASNY
jgi:hypothetical protein